MHSVSEFVAAVILAIVCVRSACLGQVLTENNARKFEALPVQISSGDMVDIAVYDSADLSGRYRVSEKGNITVPLIGTINILGKTAEDAQAIIEGKYIERDILKPGGARVTIFISEYATQGIVVSGEVKNPGIYPALGVRTLNDVLASAGGTTGAASSSIVIKRRNDYSHPVLAEYNPTVSDPIVPEVQIYPGDTIVVPKIGIIYVVGNVARPGGYVLDAHTQMTVEKAIALAEGERGSSSLNKVQLVRNEIGGAKNRMINLANIYKGTEKDVKMQDGDILYVPRSKAKAATSQAIMSMLGMGMSVVTYRASYK
jgi:polysaccharide biosynthesis/export protein